MIQSERKGAQILYHGWVQLRHVARIHPHTQTHSLNKLLHNLQPVCTVPSVCLWIGWECMLPCSRPTRTLHLTSDWWRFQMRPLSASCSIMWVGERISTRSNRISWLSLSQLSQCRQNSCKFSNYSISGIISTLQSVSTFSKHFCSQNSYCML